MKTKNVQTTPPIIREEACKKLRNSNLEILRILSMMAIIAHHFVVNSTVVEQYNYLDPSLNQYFLEVWGMWGKTAINSFILISGYFLCKQTLTWQRYIKLVAQIIFYSLLIYLIFLISGYEPFILGKLHLGEFPIISYINNGFVASFLAFYAFVPIYNTVIKDINRTQFKLFIIGLVFIMTIAQTFFFAPTMNEPVWYMTLYFIAAYIRNYPNRYTESLKISIVLFIGSVVLAIASVILLVFLAYYRQSVFIDRYFLVSDSNKLLALIVGLSAFLIAKNTRPFTSKFINTAAAGTFSVLLIHAASDTMRKWLWQDICQVPKLLHGNFSYLVIEALLVPIIVFAVCSFIDYWRRKYLERPFMQWINHF